MPGTIKFILRDEFRSSDHKIKIVAREQAVEKAIGLRLQGAAHGSKAKSPQKKHPE
jgi:hypothetical protein